MNEYKYRRAEKMCGDCIWFERNTDPIAIENAKNYVESQRTLSLNSQLPESLREALAASVEDFKELEVVPGFMTCQTRLKIGTFTIAPCQNTPMFMGMKEAGIEKL